jgi:hypothetical protein
MFVGLLICIILLSLIPLSLQRKPPTESYECYVREMHFMESLVYHIAYEEGSVTPERVMEFMPQIAGCHLCKKHLDLVFEFGVLKGELLVDVKTRKATITDLMRRMIDRAEEFQDFGTAWVLPRSKLKRSHGACHIFSISAS